jgi:hypothetical protein
MTGNGTGPCAVHGYLPSACSTCQRACSRGRLVRVRLTARGEPILNKLTPAHLVELHSLAAVLDELVNGAEA